MAFEKIEQERGNRLRPLRFHRMTRVVDEDQIAARNARAIMAPRFNRRERILSAEDREAWNLELAEPVDELTIGTISGFAIVCHRRRTEQRQRAHAPRVIKRELQRECRGGAVREEIEAPNAKRGDGFAERAARGR